MDLPSSGWPRRCPDLAAAARLRMDVRSAVLRSAMLSRSRPVSVERITTYMVAPLRQNGGTCAHLVRDGTVSRVNIAVVVSGGLSETLQSTPLLRTLRAGLPQARITLFGPKAAAPLAEGIPAIDDFRMSAALDHRPGPDSVVPTALA